MSKAYSIHTFSGIVTRDPQLARRQRCANVAAFARFDFDDPDRSRYIDEDFNRLWGPGVLDDPSRPVTAEVARAREIRPWLDMVDVLLDIHSMQHKTVPLTIAGWQPRGRALAQSVGRPAIVVSDRGHAEGVRMRDYAGFSDPASRRNAMLVECGQHWEAPAADVALATAAAPTYFQAARIRQHADAGGECSSVPGERRGQASQIARRRSARRSRRSWPARRRRSPPGRRS
jgi:hypothetical protein